MLIRRSRTRLRRRRRARRLDRRFLSKVVAVTNRVYDKHSSSFGFTRYGSNVASVPIIRNEELILLRAEANIGVGAANFPTAGQDLNFIRVNSGGLALKTFTAATPPATMIAELLHQKRYSLLFEGGTVGSITGTMGS